VSVDKWAWEIFFWMLVIANLTLCVVWIRDTSFALAGLNFLVSLTFILGWYWNGNSAKF
jgi:hypothetical protein